MFHTHCQARSLVWRLAAFVVVFTASVFAQVQSQAVVPNRITQPINAEKRITLQHNMHPLAQARFDQGAAPASMSTGRIMLVLKHSDTQETALQQFLSNVQDPASPSYRKWLTPSQFGELYGVSDTDLTTVTAWLQSQGFTVDKVPQARNVVIFSGNVAQIQQAFHTSIHRYFVNGETHFANSTDPQIPAALAPVIGGIASLHDFRPHPFATVNATAHFNTETKRIEPDLTLHDQQGNNYLFVSPADAATIYNTPNAALNSNYTALSQCSFPYAFVNGCDGNGVTIGVVGDSNVAADEVLAYRSIFLPSTYGAPPLNVIIDGNDPGVNGDEVEALLDLEVSAGIAPQATTNFYTAANTDLQSGLFLAIYRALEDNAVSILNVSFGGCEAFQGTSGNLQILNAWEQAAAQGISVTVSTGDSGSAGCDNPNTETIAQDGLEVNSLASTPYNIAVGGTDFNVLQGAFPTYVDTGNSPLLYYRTARSYIPENPWNNSPTTNSGSYSTNTPTKDIKNNTNIVAAGGGVSNCTQATFSGNTVTCTANSGYPQPSFQSGIVPDSLFPSGVKARVIPDVSFLAATGKYGATWVVCLDNAIKGVDTPGGDCGTVNSQVTDSTTFSGVGGTSAAAPAFAGMLALVSQSQGGARLGQADYVLYNLAGQSSLYSTIFHDVTAGNISVYCQPGSLNCGSNSFVTGYNAGTGYDAATGLGSVDVAQLVANWNKASFTPSTTSLTVTCADLMMTTGCSPNAINVPHGTLLNFVVSVNPSTATGDVVIVNNNTNNTGNGGALQNGAPNMYNGQHVFALSGGAMSEFSAALPGGSYSVAARYGGDKTTAPSTSNSVAVNIIPENSTTTLSINIYNLSSGSNYNGDTSHIPYGLFNFAVAKPQGSYYPSDGNNGLPTGTITFFDNNNLLATSAIASNGVATYTNYQVASNSFSVGSHSITASYSGDASYNTSTGNPITFTSFTVVQSVPSTTVSSSATSVGSTASVTISVAVGANSIGVPPSGTVQLYKGSAPIGSAIALTQGYSPTTGLAQSTASISLTGSQLAAIKTAKLDHPAFLWRISGGAAALACVFFFAIPARRRSWLALLVLTMTAILASSVIACSGGNNSTGGGKGNNGSSSSSSTATITAKYSGDISYTASTSAAITITVTE